MTMIHDPCKRTEERRGVTELQWQQTLSVIIPACNEEHYLPACLASLLEQDDKAGSMQVIVSANACTDDTVALARGYGPAFTARGWQLDVIDRGDGGKIGALNAGDAAAVGASRLYLDADIVCDPDLIGQLRAALDTTVPVYATGRLKIPTPRSWVSRQYGRFWQRLPFVRGGAVGAGVFAINAAGRARWDAFPPVISDDTFARLHFTPAERVEVPSGYAWPISEGLAALVRVRRRQDAGIGELYRLYPQLVVNEGKRRLGAAGILRLALCDPLGFTIYGAVVGLARSRAANKEWSRGRST
jgi:glycosyltransferase involved in cell wall biosynthesis